MKAQQTKRAVARRPRADDPAGGTRSLVRRLVELSNEPAGDGLCGLVGRPAAANADVMLDLEVDGVRCILVRAADLPPRPRPGREPPPDPALDAHVTLSPREREIARMIALGHPNKTIARVLDISSWTVGTYLRRAFAKLGVGSRAAMVARIIEEGLLEPPTPPAPVAAPFPTPARPAKPPCRARPLAAGVRSA